MVFSPVLKPDPEFPGGGHAILEFSGECSGGSHVHIRNMRSERWLGPSGWQTEKIALGTFDVVSDPSGKSLIRFGPNVVDSIEEDSLLELWAGSDKARVVWPHTILPSPSPGTGGGIGGGKGPENSGDLIVETEPDLLEPPPEPPPGQDESGATDPPRKSVALGSFLFFLVVAAVLAAGYFASVYNEADDSPELIAEPPDEPEPVLADCSAEGFNSRMDGEFARQWEDVEYCMELDERVPSEAVLRILEAGSRLGDGEALLIFGKLYDPEENLELPLKFKPNIGIATEYFRRAVDSGNAAARPFLDSACGRLDTDSNDLHRYISEDNCGNGN